MSALAHEAFSFETEKVSRDSQETNQKTRPPKLTQHEAAFLLARGPYVARLAAQERRLAFARAMETKDGEYGPNLPTYVHEELEAAVMDAQSELERFESAASSATPVGLESVQAPSTLQEFLDLDSEPLLTVVADVHEDPAEYAVFPVPDNKSEDVSIDADTEQLASTKLEDDLVKQYMREAGKFKVLEAHEEVELARGIEVGLLAQERLDEHGAELSEEEREELEYLARCGRECKELFINSNLRLVMSITKRYIGKGMTFLDLIQEGNTGLIRAVEKFDYTKGYKFSTYATWWIRQATTRAMADQARTIRLPVHAVETLNKIVRFERAFLGDTGQEAKLSDIAKELEIEEDKIVQLKKMAQSLVSLHTPLGENSEGEIGDLLEDIDQTDLATNVFREESYDQLNSVLDTFSDREALVLRMRFGLLDGKPKTLDEIGEVIGLTKERVRQIEAKTLSKLRHPSRSHFLTGLRLTSN